MRSGTIAVLVMLSSGCYQTTTRGDGGRPSAVGDGGPSSAGDAGPLADARGFCTDRLFWECRRDQFAARIGDDEYDACIGTITARCTGFAWPLGCAPTQGEADACITILQRADLAPITTDELYAMYTECDLCP